MESLICRCFLSYQGIVRVRAIPSFASDFQRRRLGVLGVWGAEPLYEIFSCIVNGFPFTMDFTLKGISLYNGLYFRRDFPLYEGFPPIRDLLL